MLVLPEFRCQIIWCSNFLNFFIIDAILSHGLLSNPLQRVGLPRFHLFRATWINPLDIAEITKFGRIILSQEDIQRLDISMYHVSCVQIMHTETNVDENFPKKVVSKGFAILLLDSCAKISMLTVFHDDAYRGSLSDKAIIIANDEMRIDFRHDRHFLHGVESFFFRQSFDINFFNDISLFSEYLSGFI